MDKLFLTVLNMSLTGAFVIAGICLARIPLKRAPKIISYCLWLVAGFRMLVPFSFESVFSLIPFRAQPIPLDIVRQPELGSTPPVSNTPAVFVDRVTDAGVIGEATTSVADMAGTTLPGLITIASAVWLIGLICLLTYGVVSYLLLKRRMQSAAKIRADLYQATNIKSPFIVGILKPRIYVPAGLATRERDYVYLHESTHLRRHDHIVKYIAFFIFCLHWFNPFAWLAYQLMCMDMEMSCDETVLKEIGLSEKQDYLLCLVAMATDRKSIAISPLAFSQGGLRGRVINVLNLKKTSKLLIALAVAFALTLSVGFALSSKGEEAPSAGREADGDGGNERQADGGEESNVSDFKLAPAGSGDYSVEMEEMLQRIAGSYTSQGLPYGRVLVNENGQTYCAMINWVDIFDVYHCTIINERGEFVEVTTIEQLPDLIYRGSGTYSEGFADSFVYLKDILDILATITDEPQEWVFPSLTSYTSDGTTVAGQGPFSPEILPMAIRNQYPTPRYPENADGLTYGTRDSGIYGCQPDLMAVVATNGQTGYVYRSDLDSASGGNVHSREEASLYMQDRTDRAINAFIQSILQQTGVNLENRRAEIAACILDGPSGSGVFPTDRTLLERLRGFIPMEVTDRNIDIAMSVARIANQAAIPVYESDGTTIIGEFIIG